MLIKGVEAGQLGANCYIIMNEETKKGFIIDPGGDAEYLHNIINSLGAKIEAILLTHGHFDHVGGVVEMKNLTGAPFYICEDEIPYMDGAYVFGKLPKADRLIKDGDVLNIAGFEIKCLHTPGHSPGGISFLVNKNHLFSGDTLFQLGVGRTDFDGGDSRTLINSIKQKLFVLDDNITVYPGHGPKSSIGFEKKNNPFIQ